MDEDDNEPDTKQKSKDPLYILKKEEFVGKTSYESYMHYHHEKSNSSKEEYFRLCRTIEHGKELLPKEVEPEDVDDVNNLYNSARTALENEVPEQVTMSYSWIDPSLKKFPYLQLMAEDSGSFSFPPELLEQSVESFRETQYSKHIPKLRSIDNLIYHFLTQYKVVPSTPSIDDLLDEMVKKDLLSDETETK